MVCIGKSIVEGLADDERLFVDFLLRSIQHFPALSAATLQSGELQVVFPRSR